MSSFPVTRSSAQDAQIPNRGQRNEPSTPYAILQSQLRMAATYSHLQESGAFYANRKEAWSALKTVPSKVFAVWKRDTTEAENHGLYLHLDADDTSLPFCLRYENLPEYIESAEKVKTLVQKGQFVTGFEAGLEKMKKERALSLVCWANTSNQRKSYSVLSRQDKENSDRLTFKKDIPLINFAETVRRCEETPPRLRRVSSTQIIVEVQS